MTRSEINRRHDAIRAECERLGLDSGDTRRMIHRFDSMREFGYKSEAATPIVFATAKRIAERIQNAAQRAPKGDR
jgi:hypothetical protein